MHFVILGSGAVGGYFGARLAQSGQEVTFIARNQQLAVMKKSGLQIESIKGDFHLSNVNVIADTKAVKNVDVILIAVKSFHLSEALQSIKGLVSQQTRIIPLLNGVNAIEEIVSAGFERDNIYGGLAKIISKVKAPGVISHTGAEPHITLGCVTEQQTNLEQQRLEQIAQCFKEAGVSIGLTKNIHIALWRKFIFVAAWGALAAIEDKAVGALRSDDETKEQLSNIIKEYAQIANAVNVRVKDEMVEETLKFINKLPFNSKTSMQRDIANKQVSEFAVLVTYPYLLSLKHHLNTPVLDACYQQLSAKIKLL